MPPRGFILQASYRIGTRGPVVLLHGKLESGGSFLVRDDREIPHFFIEARDIERARQLGATRARSSPKRTTEHGPVARVEVPAPADVPPLRERLHASGISCYEADVPFATRYLIDRGIRACLTIDGPSQPGDGVDRVYQNPQLAPADWTPRLTCLSLDIETDPHGQRLLSVALAGCGAEEVLLLAPEGLPTPPGARPFPTERELLDGLCRKVRELDPDVITGWNLVDFDLKVLVAMAERLGVPLELGRGPGKAVVHSGYARARSRAVVPGRLVLDGLALLRGAFVRMDSYSLDAVARKLLGEGKQITGPSRAQQILRAFESDRELLVRYNLNDARLVLRILDQLQLLELAVERSRLTGLTPDRISSSIAAFDFLYLSELARRDIVAPTIAGGAEAAGPTTGGHVLEPEPGLYRNVAVLDFKSLYPSIIRTFQIDPLGRLADPATEPDPIMAPNGAAFRRQKGILTSMLDELFPRREAARASGNSVASQAIKILMNSFYGVLGTPACRFHSPALANAITGFGRELLLWTQARIESRGRRVLYGDTDSLFVLIGDGDPAQARAEGERLAADLNVELARHVAQSWKVESRLEVQFETLYLRLLLPHVRHGAAGARKRYAGLVEQPDGKRVVFTGMESVRRDWTRLAREVQRELYERLFFDREVEAYLRETVADLRAGRLDELLVYRRALRKELGAYTATTPPHVAAARKMQGRAGGLIRYVITAAGPEPEIERLHAPDYEHYVQRQVRPVAAPVLELLGLDFDRVIGDDRQRRLF